MSLTQLTVTASQGFVAADGTPGSGKVVLQPAQEATGGGWIITTAPISMTVRAGQIVPPDQIASNAQATTLQYLVYERINGAVETMPYVVTPTGSVLDLSTAARGPVGALTPIYVLASQLGVPGGVATLDPITGFVLAGQLPPEAATMQPWDVAKAFSGPFNPSAITPLGNDPAVAFQPDVNTTITSKSLTCTELILIDNTIEFVNCDIVCTNSTFGIRTDANTGFETGRVFRNCRITSAGVALSGGSGLTATLCEIYNGGDDAARFGRTHAQGPTLELCYIHDFMPQAGAHFDGIQQQTPPAADVHVWGCWIEMALAPGFSLPEGAGTTGAIFLDGVEDNPIPEDDPEPLRIGRVIVEQCRLSVTTGNYTVVADMDGLDVSNSMLLPGSTAISSIADGITVTGHGNVDANGDPLTVAGFQGFAAEPGTLGQLQDVDLLDSPPADGDTLVYNGTSKKWAPGSAGGGFTQVINKQRFTSGDIAFTNTLGAMVPIRQVGGALIEADVAASVGHWCELHVTDLRTTGPAAIMDIGVMVGSSVVRWLSSDTSTPAGDGLVSFYSDPANFTSHGDLVGFTVTSGDLDGGSVRFVLAVNSNGTQTLKCSAGNPVTLVAKNTGPHN